jgi:hypothetical protein
MMTADGRGDGIKIKNQSGKTQQRKRELKEWDGGHLVVSKNSVG